MNAGAATRAGRRVVVLSRGGRFLTRVMAELDGHGLRPSAVVLYRESAAPSGTRSRRIPAPLLAALRAGRAWLRLRRMARGLRQQVPTVVSGTLKSRRLPNDLWRLAPDVVVLAGCGLVPAECLAVAREGVVNVHPALLPWVRGNSPLANSLLRGVPPGGSSFRVDPGIDTGPVLERRLVPVRGGETREELQAATYALWIEMTADLVAAALAGPVPAGSPQDRRFPLCRTVTDPEQLQQVDEAVRNGVAKTLFDRWRPLCDPERLVLPATAAPAAS